MQDATAHAATVVHAGCHSTCSTLQFMQDATAHVAHCSSCRMPQHM